MQTISEIDKNLKVAELPEEPLQFYDVREAPFQIYGLYRPQEDGPFKRLPDQLAQETNEGVAVLYRNTAGGRVRFSTDSRYIAIRAVMPSVQHMSKMPLTGSAGFDLYVDEGEKSTFAGALVPPEDMTTGYVTAHTFPDRRLRHITIHFPLYNDVSALSIGLQPDAVLEPGAAYRWTKPVLYYGSSITQGGCASRPGNSYPAIISRRCSCDYYNFGFSGSARGEEGLLRYLAQQEAGIFVCDYDHNAPTPEHLLKTHRRAYEIIRAQQPELPILLVGRPGFQIDNAEEIERRSIIYATYQAAAAAGDRHVYYVDGQSLFQGEGWDCCTVDGTHPNDLGFFRMAEMIGTVIHRILSE